MPDLSDDGHAPLDLVVQRSRDGWSVGDSAGARPAERYASIADAEEAARLRLGGVGGRIFVRDGDRVLRVLTLPAASAGPARWERPQVRDLGTDLGRTR